MPTEGQRRQSRPRLEADMLLLVEGRDEVNLFEKFVQHCLDDDAQSVQVLEVGGKDRFRRRFELIKTGRPDSQGRRRRSTWSMGFPFSGVRGPLSIYPGAGIERSLTSLSS